jgi:hypothetical protein
VGKGDGAFTGLTTLLAPGPRLGPVAGGSNSDGKRALVSETSFGVLVLLNSTP